MRGGVESKLPIRGRCCASTFRQHEAHRRGKRTQIQDAANNPGERAAVVNKILKAPKLIEVGYRIREPDELPGPPVYPK